MAGEKRKTNICRTLNVKHVSLIIPRIFVGYELSSSIYKAQKPWSCKNSSIEEHPEPLLNQTVLGDLFESLSFNHPKQCNYFQVLSILMQPEYNPKERFGIQSKVGTLSVTGQNQAKLTMQTTAKATMEDFQILWHLPLLLNQQF